MWSARPFAGGSLARSSLVLSFDDGPGAATPELAHYLAEEGIQAVFFVVGRHVRRRPSTITRLLELGHVVGNHTENHLHLTGSFVTDTQAVAEFIQTDEALAELCVPSPSPFRPPYGAWNAHLAHLFNGHRAIRMNGVGPLNWDINGEDHRFWSEQRSPEACFLSYMAAIEKQKRGVVLLHDYSADDELTAARNKTYEMVRLLVPRLREAGYGFAPPGSLSQLSVHVGPL